MKKQINKIYLAIPYSKIDKQYSYELVNKATIYFINKGNNVYSPITHTHPLVMMGLDGAWDFWAECDYQFIDWADEIVVVIPPVDNGWQLVEESVGVQAEIKYGKKTGKPVKYFDYETKMWVKKITLHKAKNHD